MLLFGHLGITLASAALGFRLKDKLRHEITEDRPEDNSTARGNYSLNNMRGSKATFFRSLANRMDIRVFLIGCMLPDVIDKPIGVYFFRETFSNGRIFSHTLLFLVLIILIGALVREYSGKSWGLVLSFGALFHLTLDEMWLMPKTLLWPLFGIGFEKYEIGNWVLKILYGLLHNPKLYFTEIIGFIVLVWFVWGLMHQRSNIMFLKQGRVQ